MVTPIFVATPFTSDVFSSTWLEPMTLDWYLKDRILRVERPETRFLQKLDEETHVREEGLRKFPTCTSIIDCWGLVERVEYASESLMNLAADNFLELASNTRRSFCSVEIPY